MRRFLFVAGSVAGFAVLVLMLLVFFDPPLYIHNGNALLALGLPNWAGPLIIGGLLVVCALLARTSPNRIP